VFFRLLLCAIHHKTRTNHSLDQCHQQDQDHHQLENNTKQQLCMNEQSAFKEEVNVAPAMSLALIITSSHIIPTFCPNLRPRSLAILTPNIIIIFHIRYDNLDREETITLQQQGNNNNNNNNQ
jgi:hypothetical protein